jgi:RHH-type rel operon transcriptional repressor/antitoxin RelB
MIALHLTPELESRIESLQRTTGRTAAEIVEAAILAQLDALEDLAEAEQALADIRAGRTSTLSLDEVERQLGLAD